MTLVMIVIVLAGGGALFLGGSPRRLLQVPLRRRRLLLTAAGAVLLGYAGSSLWDPAFVVGAALGSALVAYFTWINRLVAGLPLIGTGVALNGLVMLANLGVPVSLDALRRSGSDLTAADIAASPWREAIDDMTILPFLGDVLPLAWPVAPQVVSLGDVLLAAGAGLYVVFGMTDRALPPGLPVPAAARAAAPGAPTAAATGQEAPVTRGTIAAGVVPADPPQTSRELEGVTTHGQEGT